MSGNPKRSVILNEAMGLINGARQAQYGTPQESFGRIARIWGALLGVEIKPWQVAQMMAALKLARSVQSPDKDDSWIDLAGYAALAAELATPKATTKDCEIVGEVFQHRGDGYVVERTADKDVLIRIEATQGMHELVLHSLPLEQNGTLRSHTGRLTDLFFYDVPPSGMWRVWRQENGEHPVLLDDQAVLRMLLSPWQPPVSPLAA